MSLIRPEVTAQLVRWREALIGAALVALSAPVLASPFGLRRALAIAGIALGAVLIWQGIRRARFPKGGGGAGVVEVDERRVTYFGPAGGGAVSLDEMTRITIRTTGDGPFGEDLFWELSDTTGATLSIPGGAENAGALFDAFAALSGVDWDAVTRASGATDDQVFEIWKRPRQRLH